MKIRVNGHVILVSAPVAAVLIAAMFIIAGAWLSLVFSNRIDAIESLKWIGERLGLLTVGVLSPPLYRIFKEKPVVELVASDSDPPKGEP